MKKHITTIIVLVLIIPSISCKSKAQLNTSEKLVYSKSNCFRKCPVYTLELDSDGQAKYVGHENVPQIGTYNFKIDDESHIKLEGALKKIEFSSLKDSYNDNIRDMPSTTLSYGDQKIVFKGHRNVPTELKAVSEILENILKNKEFIN